MSVSGKPSPAPLQLGDYRLREVISEGARTRTYHAEQISVARDVVLECIKAGFVGDAEIVEHFLADVRAKAGVDHHGIGSVYEGVHDEAAVFYTRERLRGETLEELHEAGARFSPGRIAILLRQLSGAMAHLREREIATLPLEPRHLVVGGHDVLRLANLAVAALPDPVVDGHDRQLVAEMFHDLLKEDAAGATRVGELIARIASAHGTELSWSEIHQIAGGLEQELSEGAKAVTQKILSDHAEEARRQRVGRTVTVVLVVFLVVAVLGAGAFLLTRRKTPPVARDLSAMVEIPAGRYEAHDGKRVALERFWIDAHEVSIGEYAAFLQALRHLSPENRTAYDHPDQPASKDHHLPEAWESMLAAARAGGSFEGQPLDLNYPITRIDWWDAHAYATWKGGRLPTQEEWLAASHGDPIAPAPRGAVDSLPGDLTSRGVHGLAGNVSEWVRDPVTRPAFPMNPKRPVCCGASYRDPRNGARARSWPTTRGVRRPEVGFRIVRDRAP